MHGHLDHLVRVRIRARVRVRVWVRVRARVRVRVRVWVKVRVRVRVRWRGHLDHLGDARLGLDPTLTLPLTRTRLGDAVLVDVAHRIHVHVGRAQHRALLGVDVSEPDVGQPILLEHLVRVRERLRTRVRVGLEHRAPSPHGARVRVGLDEAPRAGLDEPPAGTLPSP